MIEESTTNYSKFIQNKNLARLIFEAALVSLILVGVFFRFNWVNWSEGTNLHPDEYGLTGTLTQLSVPKNLSEYFNTRISPLSPYQKYDEAGNPTVNGPDNRMRWGQWPIIIFRLAGEYSGKTGYDEIRLLGRSLSALADTLSLLFIFLIGRKLYGRTVGLLAAALSALAVMQIQQSHFMTVDNFGSLFTTMAMFACVQITKDPPALRGPKRADGLPAPYHLSRKGWFWYALFGVAFGMALASKINLLPIGGMVLIAAFIGIADLKIGRRSDLGYILMVTSLCLILAFLTAGLTFRVTQPMSFRATSGDTTFLTIHPNQDWVDSMVVASSESSGGGGGPPGEQWAHRPVIIFPWVNMVLWGMGLPLGLAAWASFCIAFWQWIRSGKDWKIHLLPMVWVGGYFFFMATRWVKSIRYFLPIYPFLCLLAAWGLVELWNWARRSREQSSEKPERFQWRSILAFVLIGITILGTFAWSGAFVQAVYITPHTRIQATRWIYQNIPGPFHLAMQLDDGTTHYEPVGAPDGLQITSEAPFVQSFMPPVSGQVFQVTLPKVQATLPATVNLKISSDPEGQDVIGETEIPITVDRGAVVGKFQDARLNAGETYYLSASTKDKEVISIFHTVITDESWDEALPMPFEGRDPFGALYRGVIMEVRWLDVEEKRQMFIDTLADADYLIMPSQRSIWSICRIPNSYPMTMEYYRALFDGRLGFDKVALFSAPFKVGPLWISDVGGTMAWNQVPSLPLFNHSYLAAEEAFSVYDHPPVWVFKKRPDFNPEQVKAILNTVDLSKVVAQMAINADGDWCPEK